MPLPAGQLSENSRRLARNTLLLYFRMLLLMLIGLFTSRVVLRSLGIDDYGVYTVVGGVVSVFTFLTTSLSAAICPDSSATISVTFFIAPSLSCAKVFVQGKNCKRKSGPKVHSA